ncbi:MAG: 4Fe-4S dicluster domain-containing protein [Planctomycetes bacterium]|nr:4Fe-4S dicluster domain-containing protein [Planctomycetota bacterium]
MKTMGMLIDVNMCGGCHECMAACMKKQGFEGDPEQVTKLSATARTILEHAGDYNVRKFCRHCIDPACVGACPAKALVRTDYGAVKYDSDRCMGCRYCMISCPYDIPRYEWDEVAPKIQKCDMCWDRIEAGGIPACAEACPAGATLFGEREELLAEARTRIQDAPEEYLDYIYGEHDNGGYAILMIGPKEIAAVRGGIDFADSSPAAIARGVLKQLPGFAVVGAAALFGIYWFAGRRNRVMAEKARARTDDRLPKPPKGGKESNHVTA